MFLTVDLFIVFEVMVLKSSYGYMSWSHAVFLCVCFRVKEHPRPWAGGEVWSCGQHTGLPPLAHQTHRIHVSCCTSVAPCVPHITKYTDDRGAALLLSINSRWHCWALGASVFLFGCVHLCTVWYFLCLKRVSCSVSSAPYPPTEMSPTKTC